MSYDPMICTRCGQFIGYGILACPKCKLRRQQQYNNVVERIKEMVGQKDEKSFERALRKRI